MEFHDLSATYLNTPEWHGDVFDDMFQKVQETPYLKEHRDWVEKNEWGMGDRPFHWMWKCLIETMPDSFKFMEIGCYRGQVLSLVALLAQKMSKTVSIYGVSPFVGTSDSQNSYNPEIDYIKNIEKIFGEFSLDYSVFTPIKGYSQADKVIEMARLYAPIDILYIDGSHVYEDVKQDIDNYAPLLKVGGILVMDDASNLLNLPPFSTDKGYGKCWPGLPAVSAAVRDFLEPRTDFVHRFAVGHNRIFEKIK